ncbi:MAG: hypothetical protein Q8N37_02315 [bacterium]|nr:hypothetical protein [bacterium]
MLNQIFRFIYPPLSSFEIRRKYNIPDKFNLTVELTVDGFFVLTSEELPGLITEAKDGKELIKMFNDAVLTYYDVPKREGDIAFERLNLDGYGTFTLKADNRVKQEA